MPEATPKREAVRERIFEITFVGRGQLLQGLETGCKRAAESKYTWVLCWTDSWTIGEMASSRSVGMID